MDIYWVGMLHNTIFGSLYIFLSYVVASDSGSSKTNRLWEHKMYCIPSAIREGAVQKLIGMQTRSRSDRQIQSNGKTINCGVPHRPTKPYFMVTQPQREGGGLLLWDKSPTHQILKCHLLFTQTHAKIAALRDAAGFCGSSWGKLLEYYTWRKCVY